MVFSKVRESQEKSGSSSGGQGENPCLKFESQEFLISGKQKLGFEKLLDFNNLFQSFL